MRRHDRSDTFSTVLCSEVGLADENREQQFSTKSKRKKEGDRERSRDRNMEIVTAKPSQKYLELVSRL